MEGEKPVAVPPASVWRSCFSLGPNPLTSESLYYGPPRLYTHPSSQLPPASPLRPHLTVLPFLPSSSLTLDFSCTLSRECSPPLTLLDHYSNMAFSSRLCLTTVFKIATPPPTWRIPLTDPFFLTA